MASASRVDGFGALSGVAAATASAWAAAEDAAAPTSSANALSATRIGAMRRDDQQVPLVPAAMRGAHVTRCDSCDVEIHRSRTGVSPAPEDAFVGPEEEVVIVQ